MGKSIPVRWIEQAEIRSFRDHAMLQRAASDPHVNIEDSQAGLPPLDWLRQLLQPLGRPIAAARSSLVGRSTPSQVLSVAALRMRRTDGNADRIRAAVLITDIVGSTKLVIELGDRDWRVLLDRHNDAIRHQLKRFGGHEVGNRGDGFVGIFDTPARAVCCATAIADSVVQLGLSLRCGIHFGEIHYRSNNISGLTAHITARIAATARPGEAFVSQRVRDLVTESDLVFEDRGVHWLRDLPEKIQLYAVHTVVRR